MKRKTFLKYSFITAGFLSFQDKLLARPYNGLKRFLVNQVKFIWSGAITADSARVLAKMTNATSNARLVVSTSPSLSNPIYSNLVSVGQSTNLIAKFQINGLLPDTKYYYGVESDGFVDTAADSIGSFRTVKNGPLSYKFTVGSCMGNASHPVFSKIAEKEPLLHIVHGDFHYDDPNSATDINEHRAPYENRINKPQLKNLFKNCPFVYTWDDHDFSGNDSWILSPGRVNARLAYQEYVPHYPLVEGSGNVPIYQSFVIGRIKFLLTDLRSERTADSVMGNNQKQWFKNECLSAKNSGQAIIWISSIPWGPQGGGDSWGAFPHERKDLSKFFKDNQIRHLLIICGDAHMLGLDNGSNHDFTDGSSNPNKYPVFHAGALTGGGSYKGGTFSHGIFLNPDHVTGQYGMVEINDNGGPIQVKLTGFRVSNYGQEEQILNYTFSFDLPTVLPIKIYSFEAAAVSGNKAKISWDIEPSPDCHELIIERSKNGSEFHPLKTIACAGTTYRDSYYDESPAPGVNYYRLLITEKSGEKTYSEIKRLRFDAITSLEFVENPVSHHLQVKVHLRSAEKVRYVIHDTSGRRIREAAVQLEAGFNQLNVPVTALSPGAYYFTLHSNDLADARKFIKK